MVDSNTPPARHAPGDVVVAHLRSGATVARVISHKGRRVVVSVGGGMRRAVGETWVRPHTPVTGLACERRRDR